MDEQQLHDSGERRTFSTGAQRDRGDLKPRPDLISPHAQMREGIIYALGAEKYDVRNWEAGMPISECLASAQRHIEQYKRGDTDEDHLAQARWNLGAIIHYEEEIKAGRMDPALDDMPKYAQQDVDIPWVESITRIKCEEPYPANWHSIMNSGNKVHIIGGTNIERQIQPTDFCRACGASIPHRMGEGTCSKCDKIPPYPDTHVPNDPEMLARAKPAEDDGCLPMVVGPGPGWHSEMDDHGSVYWERDAIVEPGGRIQPIIELKGIVYIAGPMRGLPQYNFPAFDAARDRWNSWHYAVISPADLDRNAGFDPTGPKPCVLELDKGEVIKRDILAIIGNLKPNGYDAIALLPGWENSGGAAVEIALGKFLGLKFVDALTGKWLEV